jgi:hypothetical protein
MATGTQTTNPIYQMIRQAILDRDIVVANYRGHLREMCPHAIGTKHGRQQSLMYQFAGGSSTGLELDGSPANWRCVIVEELSDVSIRKALGGWHTASNYSSAAQKCIDVIETQV